MFGSHLSIAGGMHNALLSAETYGMETVQVFTKNQQQWRCRPLEAEAVEAWRSHCRRLKFKQTVSHDSYLINLASPDEALWLKSVDLFVEEVRRCASLKIPYLVTHPGAHMGAGEAAGLKRVAEALELVGKKLRDAGSEPAGSGKGGGFDGVTVCLEITAGQGSSLGHRLEHLAEIIQRVKSRRRLGVCLDTAHLFAAGYDFRGRRYRAFMREVDRVIGLKRVKVLHLNDSKKALGSRVDRHEHIGRGAIGLEGFRPLVRDEMFAAVPKILETPKGRDEKGRDWDEINLRSLLRLRK